MPPPRRTRHSTAATNGLDHRSRIKSSQMKGSPRTTSIPKECRRGAQLPGIGDWGHHSQLGFAWGERMARTINSVANGFVAERV